MSELMLDKTQLRHLETTGVSVRFQRELRCSHAGETGACWIYRGILATRPNAEMRQFALAHLKSETEHLKFFEDLQCCYRPSMLLPLWRFAGFLTGWIPALVGNRAVFATIEAVETFVDEHYREQIKVLKPQVVRESEIKVLAGFEYCRLEEVHHRDDAKQRSLLSKPLYLRLWMHLVRLGSQIAVKFAKAV
ncbi:demethoxyubiquinone hydroxylase family protein [Marinobacter sp. M-5]|uniref:demethoxyubiquinone hydroxylase family protein n=1 Tax=Marinobacter sp. M-5 TaxID=3081089 RepID=UPI00293CF2B9|nr:demethoxyubiquinone hydroxylase family protein [Marinobacter sp. M-5]MDV3502741.1 demethoxyubiquinone hydroxylase family protein [Marinobacter sp. M-5]